MARYISQAKLIRMADGKGPVELFEVSVPFDADDDLSAARIGGEKVSELLSRAAREGPAPAGT